MAAKLTLDTIDAFYNCRLKAYLKLRDQQGVKSDYETMQMGFRQQLQQMAIQKIRSRYGDDGIAIDIPVTCSALKRGVEFLIDAKLNDERYLIKFDGLKKVDGPSDLGVFHYVPVLFSEVPRVRQSHRYILEILGFLLSRVQGKAPGFAIVYYGCECRTTSIRLTINPKAIEARFEEALRLRAAETAPTLLLNDHCVVCEFRQQCRAQAVQEDNLRLLRGIGEKAIKRYGRKGLFTLTQLAHTFRPRRKGKRSDRPNRQRNYALQALALRDKTIYVLGSPKVPSGITQVFLDVEGYPDEQFIYLIGAIVRDSNREECFSFWAENRAKEYDIFERFLNLVTSYGTVQIFCYGNYERAFLNRLRKHARRKKQADTALNALVNILSIIYEHFYFPTYSNSLKEIAGYLGFSWSGENASGLQSMVWRSKWEEAAEERWKEKLLKYNL